MNMLSVWIGLSSALTPIGVVGAAVAVCSAVAAAIALASGYSEVGGGAVSAWLVGTMASLATCFTAEWAPTILAVTSFPALYLVAMVLRIVTTRLVAHGMDIRTGAGAKLKGRQPRFSPKEDAAIARHLEEGEFTPLEIATMFKTSRASVYRAAQRHATRQKPNA